MGLTLTADAPQVNPPDIVEAATVGVGDDGAQSHVVVARHGDRSASVWVSEPVMCSRCRHKVPAVRLDAAGRAATACCGVDIAVPQRRVPATSPELFEAAAAAAAESVGREHTLRLVSVAAVEAAAREDLAERFIAAFEPAVAALAAGVPASHPSGWARRILEDLHPDRRREMHPWAWQGIRRQVLDADRPASQRRPQFAGAGRPELAGLTRHDDGWRCEAEMRLSPRYSDNGAAREEPPATVSAVALPEHLSEALDCWVTAGHLPSAWPAANAPPPRWEPAGFWLPDEGERIGAVVCAPLPDGGIAATAEGGRTYEYAAGTDVPAGPLPQPLSRRVIAAVAADARCRAAAEVALAAAVDWTPTFGLDL